MKARNILLTASFALIAGNVLAAGADGPSFPSMGNVVADANALSRAEVRADATQARATNELFAAPDGDTNQTDAVLAAQGRSRSEVRAELAEAITVGQLDANASTRQFGGATTRY